MTSKCELVLYSSDLILVDDTSPHGGLTVIIILKSIQEWQSYRAGSKKKTQILTFGFSVILTSEL